MNDTQILKRLGAVIGVLIAVIWGVAGLKWFGFRWTSISLILAPFFVAGFVHFQKKLIYLIPFMMIMPQPVVWGGYKLNMFLIPAWFGLVVVNVLLHKERFRIPKEWWIIFGLFLIAFAVHPTSPTGVLGGKSEISGFQFDFKTGCSLLTGFITVSVFLTARDPWRILCGLPRHLMFWSCLLTFILFCMFLFGIGYLPIPGWDTSYFSIVRGHGGEVRVNAASATGVIIFIYSLSYLKLFKKQMTAWMVCGVAVAIIFWAGGRHGLLSIIVFTGFYLLLHRKWGLLTICMMAGFGLLSIPFLAPGLFSNLPPTMQRILTIVSSDATEVARSASGSAESRLEFWTYALDQARQHWAFGKGPFRVDFRTGYVFTFEDMMEVYSYYHGIYVSAMTVYGVPFFLVFVFLILRSITRGIRLLVSCKNDARHFAPLIFFCGMLVTRSVTALIGGSISGSSDIFFLWAIFFVFGRRSSGQVRKFRNEATSVSGQRAAERGQVELQKQSLRAATPYAPCGQSRVL